MKKNILIIAFTASTWGAFSQVGIGTLNPNSSAMLDVVGSNKGVLIPRVGLQNHNDTTTVQGSINGRYENSLLVFNTQQNDSITPGYYYWYLNKWHRLLNQEDVTALDTNTKNQSIAVVNGNLIITDTDQQVISVPISDFNMITTFVNNQNGTYSYTSENGLTTQINVVQDVQNNFQQIVDHSNVQSILDTLIKNTSGMVQFDGTNFFYVDFQGQIQNISWNDLVDMHQKKVSLINGNYTTVESSIDTNNSNHTIWKVNVQKAKGALDGNESMYGVVKENAVNPTVSINQSGELSVNNANINRVKYVNNNYTISLEDAILLGDASTSNINITLPNAAQNNGKRLIIKKEDSNENYYVTVNGEFLGSINELYTALPYSGWEFVSDGTHWKIINKF